MTYYFLNQRGNMSDHVAYCTTKPDFPVHLEHFGTGAGETPEQAYRNWRARQRLTPEIAVRSKPLESGWWQLSINKL